MEWRDKKWLIAGLVVILGITGWGVYDHNLESKNAALEAEYNNSAVFQTPLKGATITGRTLAAINKGDFVHPKLSPNGQLLVYSEVIIEKGKDNYNHEYTQIKLFNIEEQTEITLLDTKASKQYAYFGAFVTDINWLNNEQIEVTISDGDTGISTLKFDLPTESVIKTAFHEDDLLDYELSPEKQNILEKAADLFPDFDKDVLRAAIENSAIFLPGWGLVLQQKLSRDNHIWFLNFHAKKLVQLASFQDGNYRLEGGFVFKDIMLFLVAGDTFLKIYCYQGKKVDQITSINSNQRNISLEVKYQQPDQAFFLVKMYDSYEKGNNPFFIFDGKQLIRIIDCPELYDVDIDPEGEKAVFCYWEHGERHLVVKELK